MCLDSSTTKADRLQNELFRFMSEDVSGFDATRALPELRELMEHRTLVAGLMRSDGWRLVESSKGSAADMVGMDFIFINLKDDRYFFIDITVDTECKKGLPFLRTESVFRLTVNEDERVDVDTKQRFLELLFDLMGDESVLSVKETPPPNFSSSLSFKEIAQQIENFRKQLDSRVARLQREVVLEDAPAVLTRDAEIIHEYSVHLARALAFAKGEHERTTDLEYKAKVEHFSGCMQSALFDAIRSYLGLRTNQARSTDTQRTHTVVYDKRLDQLTLTVNDSSTFFKLYRMSSMVDSIVAKVCGKARNTPADFFQLKRNLCVEQGRARVIADAITIIHSTKVHSLLGVPHVVPPTKTAIRKQKKRERALAEAAAANSKTA